MAPNLFNASGSIHMIVRQLFVRLVFSLQMESSLSMQIISYWLWLEGNGHSDFLARIDLFDNYHLREVALAAKLCIEDLYLKSSQSNHRSVQGECFHKEVVKGISFYLNNICFKAIADILQIVEAKEHIYHSNQVQQQNMKGKAPMSTKDLLSKIKASFTRTQSLEEGTSSQSMVTPKTHTCKNINNPIDQCLSTYPLANLFDSLNIKEEPTDAVQMQQRSRVPRDERTLFVTFSNGYPFTKEELYDFFMGNFGDVEIISVEEPVERRPPLYAHITFFTQETIFRILGQNPRIKFVIRGKHLWARQFVPKRKKTRKN
ncbi:hypothetical protein U9M48_012408 [Paspalum notatum var. saurae]|uniref:RRM domain-containing protein n=1 Tax=Paspalum notatum var. saurae TaxID=547442 RepID=A0AAQ3SZU8_PASNO